MGVSDAGLTIWTCYERAVRHENRTADEDCVRPFSTALANSGVLPTTPLTKMRQLLAQGWPAARSAMIDRQGKRIVVRPDKKTPEIWELKCKPSCWRLYFYVYEEKHWIVFLLAVCKKKWPANLGHAQEARNLLAELRPGGSCALIEFEFPSRGDVS